MFARLHTTVGRCLPLLPPLPRYLLKVGANVNQPNAQGLTPLGAATQNRQEATMEVLRAHGAQ